MKLKIDWKAALRAIGKFLLRIGEEELKQRLDERSKRGANHNDAGLALLLSALLLLGACGTVQLPRIDCREQPPAGEPQCPDGLTCKPDPRFVSLWTCQATPPPPTTQLPASPQPPASPSPTAPPTPEPPASPSPTAPPTAPPTPTPGASPSSNDATLFRVGLGEKIQNIVKGRHGTRYIINSTPRSRRPWCEYTTEKALWEAHRAGDKHALGELTPAQEAAYRAKEAAGTLADGVEAQRIECEQHPSRQDPRGPKGYQTHLGGAFTNHDLEQNSTNPYLFQIKISDPAEAGDYLIRVCPYDDSITSPRCSERIYRDIRP